jgi:hypothetical protein
MIAVDWVAFGGIAQGIAALATIGLAVTTVVMAKATKKLAADTTEEAKATRSMADEAKVDRGLTWRPQLGLASMQLNMAPPGTWVFALKNSGGGPALDSRGLVRWPSNIGLWTMIAFGDLTPGQATDRIGADSWKTGGSPYELFNGFADNRDAPEVMLFCSDVLGRRWRFPIRTLNSAVEYESAALREGWKVYPGEVAAPGDENQPMWSQSPLLWSD